MLYGSIERQQQGKVECIIRYNNLSKEIHRMIPPNLDFMFLSIARSIVENNSDDDIFNILEENSNAFFAYLKRQYKVDGTLEKIEEECSKQYTEYEREERSEREYKR